jgi:hypothetical protein
MNILPNINLGVKPTATLGLPRVVPALYHIHGNTSARAEGGETASKTHGCAGSLPEPGHLQNPQNNYLRPQACGDNLFSCEVGLVYLYITTHNKIFFGVLAYTFTYISYTYHSFLFKLEFYFDFRVLCL